MEKTEKKSSIWGVGLAMFAMFFGSGNIVFPLALGQMTQDKNLYGILGMVITAVLVPLMGLLSMMLFEGNYYDFFRRIGKVPGFLITLIILGIIGPFGVAPRCIAVSYSTLSAFGVGQITGVNLLTFSLASCVLIYLFTFRPSKILNLLGYVLTPILLLALGIIVIKGIFLMPERAATVAGKWAPFAEGFVGGYNTMDLLAAFFFSSVVLVCLKKNTDGLTLKQNKRLLLVAILGGFIASAMLAIVYISFSYLAAGFSASLENTPNAEMLGALSYQLLGPSAGLIASIAVCFACLTTEIALVAVFAQFLQKTLFKEKISYQTALIVSLAITFLVSTLRFEGISSFLVPITRICYPALIVLAILNLLYKLYAFKPVKLPVYATLGAAAFYYMIH